MDSDERIQAASQFLLQAPPGEINDVLNDVRNIIADDDSLQSGVLPALKEYNLSQFIVTEIPGSKHQTIVSEAAKLEGTEDGSERFLDPRSKQTFSFDHLSLEASDLQPAEATSDSESFRAALETASLTYLAAHYHDGVTAVFSDSTSATKYTVQIVANKYNPTNFWSGRWRSEYIIDTDAKSVEGRILVNVHYYEQGNVQLESTHTTSFNLPPGIDVSGGSGAATKLLALVEDEERKYQNSLNDTYHDMGEKTFKSLRRALPLTRQKLDWDKVMGYKLGAELSASKGVFSGSAEA